MSGQNSTLTTCNGGATGLLKDIQRRLSSSGILPGLKPPQDPPSLVVPQSNSSPPNSKPFKVANVSNHNESYDTLYLSADKSPCHAKLCRGSVMYNNTWFASAPRTKEEVLVDAKDFLDQYYTSIRRLNTPTHKNRWDQVQKAIKDTGTYQLTETELTFGAKLAWRNAPRCIGRIQWSKLQVFDCRQVTTTTGMFEAICNHIKYATNKGYIRSAITVFPQRTDGKHDFRIWNYSLLGYAGYRNADGTITGDPISADFTEFCIKLGWKPPTKRSSFDILPLVLQSSGHDPDYFDVPKELIMEVKLTHPRYDWFEQLGIKWYVVPAVSSMMLDCGGLQFTGAPFNGWYMGTEIGCRDLCDTERYNILSKVATHMGLDTRSVSTLWKDQALVEVNIAVIHSFHKENVTLVDHHTASESFMKHFESEQRLRKGCPADWVWVVPPMSASITPVFHQEMPLYLIKPGYFYQDSPWKTFVFKKDREPGSVTRKPRRKFHFKQLARAVKFTSKLFGKALSKRIKATILYASETGKSETFAKRLVDIFGHAFNSQVCRMDDYDISNIEHEALLLVVASTSGNGDPPENGLEFAQNLYELRMDGNRVASGDEKDSFNMASSKSFIKLNSQNDPTVPDKRFDRMDSMRGSSMSDMVAEEVFGPLSNVRFAVFALGSSAYPNFCAFGKYVDHLLLELGGERLMKLSTGDEMCAQEQVFNKWAVDVFNVSCEAFCLDDDETFLNGEVLGSTTLKDSTVRLVEATSDATPLHVALAKCHNRKVLTSHVLSKTPLHKSPDQGQTISLELSMEEDVQYQPGDHLGVFPANRPELVEGIIQLLDLDSIDPDSIVELQILKENHTPNGVVENWEPHDRLACCSLRTMLSRFLDITTPPAPNVLGYLATVATDKKEKEKLLSMETDFSSYEDWRHCKYPHLLEVLQEFPSCRPKASVLSALLQPLQPRFYSISSSPLAHPGQVHLTVAVVTYRIGSGPDHYGVCSNFLNSFQHGDELCVFVRSAPAFHLPEDLDKPVILVGPGTGIAPFRGFWHHRAQQFKDLEEGTKPGSMWLFFGCRTRALDLYNEEKADMVSTGIVERSFLALSREPSIPKTYVQDLMRTEKHAVYRKLVKERGHFYVCGDCTMAEHVYQTLKQIIQELGNYSGEEVENYLLLMRDENRYHEDIFGITLRTAEVHSRSRESARMRMTSHSSS